MPGHECFAITAPGLEALTATELQALGVTPSAVERGGVTWTGPIESVYEANLHLRTASRVIVRVATFHARTFAELERRGKQVRWDHFVTPGRPVRLRVTCRKSRLYHSDAVIQRLIPPITAVVGNSALVGAARGTDEVDAPDAQLFVVRIDRDEVTVSVDTSGALLHRRGYRQAIGKAPLRETLAAAMLLGSAWDGHLPLLDPFCGSGTIPIEAAMLARRIPPGLHRAESATGFACLQWPGTDVSRWGAVVTRAREQVLPRAPGMILASDRDAGAARAALENAERAGVATDVDVTQAAISGVSSAGRRGWVITNPPYGVRVGDRDVRNLYAQLGNVLRDKFQGWNVGLLTAYDSLGKQTRVSLEQVFEVSNGGIPVHYLAGVVRALTP